ncbi:acyltransferase family protein [Prauserella cavernicola]|uniref:Acyltransferase n=1 Tax=Prauserella cavernicola TaxID=2800127 RepID=A0A934QXW0_9PSEU|nr:acyltransferase [Prauserella cavernicola]MBK1788538.1 acyltransferase [Prauserella cavernicola]
MTTFSRSHRASSRRLSWDVIRVIAIVFVVTGHVTALAARVPGIEPYPVAFSAPFGTATLLVLSGYFIGPTIRRGAAGTWFRARLARVLPAYLVALLITYVSARLLVVGFNGWRHPPGLSGLLFGAPIVPAEPAPGTLPPWHVPDLADLILHGTLLHLWNPDPYHRIDGSWWTMPIQVLAFAGAALLWRSRARHRFRPHTVLWAVIGLSAASPVLSLAIEVLPTASGFYYAHLFAVGLAIWLWQRDRLSTAHLVPMIIATIGLYAFRTGESVIVPVIGFTVMLALMCLAAKGPDWDVAVLRKLRRPIAWLSGISFGIYLIHQALGFQLARLLSEAGFGPWWLRLSVVVAFAVVLGWLVTVLVERPAYRVLTGSRPGKKRSVPEAQLRPSPEPTVSVGGAT